MRLGPRAEVKLTRTRLSPGGLAFPSHHCGYFDATRSKGTGNERKNLTHKRWHVRLQYSYACMARLLDFEPSGKSLAFSTNPSLPMPGAHAMCVPLRCPLGSEASWSVHAKTETRAAVVSHCTPMGPANNSNPASMAHNLHLSL